MTLMRCARVHNCLALTTTRVHKGAELPHHNSRLGALFGRPERLPPNIKEIKKAAQSRTGHVRREGLAS
eukprot:1094050-Pelagomonas_calceolata.AAC.1